MIIDLNKDTFEDEVLKASGKVLVDFWAPRCVPCVKMTPHLEELAKERTDVKFCRLNVDEETLIAMQHRVFGIPTFMVFENGVMTAADGGYMEKSELNALLDK